MQFDRPSNPPQLTWHFSKPVVDLPSLQSCMIAERGKDMDRSQITTEQAAGRAFERVC